MLKIKAKHIKASLFGFLLLIFQGVVFSQGVNVNPAEPPEFHVKVKAAIVQGCAIANGASGSKFGDIDFGMIRAVDYNSNAQVEASFLQSNSFLFSCTPGVNLSMSIDGGENLDGSSRRMRSPDGLYIKYDLITDGVGPILPDGEVTTTIDKSGKVDIKLKGVINLDGSQDLMPGDYEDTLMVTFTY